MDEPPQMILSGGQTGADRAALDWAIEHGIPHGGWCPKGRRAEDGPIAPQYQLQETKSSDWSQRTEWNVRDSDGTVIFTIDEKLTRGSKATAKLAEEAGKPCLHLSAKSHADNAAALLNQFISKDRIKSLNIAGPRASEEPEVADFVKAVLDTAWAVT
jgi:predicted Rossmann-fold nucleotide-binding protein